MGQMALGCAEAINFLLYINPANFVKKKRVLGPPARGGARFPFDSARYPIVTPQGQSCPVGVAPEGLTARLARLSVLRPLYVCRDFESPWFHYPREVGGAPVAIPCGALRPAPLAQLNVAAGGLHAIAGLTGVQAGAPLSLGQARVLLENGCDVS